MPKLKRLSGPEVASVFQRFSFFILAQRGSHIKLRRISQAGEKQTLTVPNHRELVLCLLNGWCFVAPSLACGEARGGSIPRSGAVTDEQRSHRPNWAQPKGRQSFSLQASLLTPYRSTSGYARRSRLAWTEKPLPQNTSH